MAICPMCTRSGGCVCSAPDNKHTRNTKCGICKIELDQSYPFKIPTMDCGGDCLNCMALAGDPDALQILMRWHASEMHILTGKMS